MALITVPPFLYPAFINVLSCNPTYMNMGANGIAGHAFHIPKAGNITKIGFFVYAVSSSGTLSTRIETVANGSPTNMAYKGCVPALTGPLSNTTWYEATLATQATAVVQGDLVMVTHRWSGAAGNIALAALQQAMGMQFPAVYSGSSGGFMAGLPNCTLYYADGTYAPIFGGFPYVSGTTVSYYSATSPNEYGNRFQVPFPCRVKGIYHPNPGQYEYSTFTLYDDSSNVLAQCVWDALNGYGSLGSAFNYFCFPAYTLAVGTWYRIAVKGTSPYNYSFANMGRITTPSAAVLSAYMPNCYSTKRTGAGAWTDENTIWNNIGLILDQVSDNQAALPTIGAVY